MYTCHSILTFPDNSMWWNIFNTSRRSHALGSFGLRMPKHAHELFKEHATKRFRQHISWHFCCRTMVQGDQFSLHSVSNEMIRDINVLVAVICRFFLSKRNGTSVITSNTKCRVRSGSEYIGVKASKSCSLFACFT